MRRRLTSIVLFFLLIVWSSRAPVSADVRTVNVLSRSFGVAGVLATCAGLLQLMTIALHTSPNSKAPPLPLAIAGSVLFGGVSMMIVSMLLNHRTTSRKQILIHRDLLWYFHNQSNPPYSEYSPTIEKERLVVDPLFFWHPANVSFWAFPQALEILVDAEARSLRGPKISSEEAEEILQRYVILHPDQFFDFDVSSEADLSQMMKPKP